MLRWSQRGMLVLVGVLGHSQLTQRLAVALANHLRLVPPSVDPRRAQHSGAITSARADVVAVDGSAGLVAVYQGMTGQRSSPPSPRPGLALPPPSRWPSFAPTFV
jgi:hypothetical protein